MNEKNSLKYRRGKSRITTITFPAYAEEEFESTEGKR